VECFETKAPSTSSEKHTGVVLALKGEVVMSKNGLAYNVEEHCKNVL